VLCGNASIRPAAAYIASPDLKSLGEVHDGMGKCLTIFCEWIPSFDRVVTGLSARYQVTSR
jgi:hypothetical protein